MFNHIVLGIDGSDHAAKATDVTAKLAKAVGSDVLFLMSSSGSPPPKEHRPPTWNSLARDAVSLVEEAAARLKKEGIKAKEKVVTAPSGRVVPKILSAAEEANADLIVVGSRGLSDFSGLLLGSVSHKLIQHANCPVLVIR